MPDDLVRKHLRCALEAIVKREAERRPDASETADTRSAMRIRFMHPVIEVLRVLQDETGQVGGLTIDAMLEGESARIEMQESSGARHSLAISTDGDNRRYEVEENQYFPRSGDRASYVHWFETAEDVLRFVVQLIGTHMASQLTLTAKLA